MTQDSDSHSEEAPSTEPLECQPKETRNQEFLKDAIKHGHHGTALESKSWAITDATSAVNYSIDIVRKITSLL